MFAEIVGIAGGIALAALALMTFYVKKIPERDSIHSENVPAHSKKHVKKKITSEYQLNEYSYRRCAQELQRKYEGKWALVSRSATNENQRTVRIFNSYSDALDHSGDECSCIRVTYSR
jgi:hypothetical protein